ncbi:MAG: hypothetical protein WBF21_09840 [Steroidobacteraceae bacterium]|jgi:hypothetical protein
MNPNDEMWSKPWHALQKDLALGLSGAVPGSFKPALKAVTLQDVAIAASSWMSRVQRPRQPPVPTRQ